MTWEKGEAWGVEYHYDAASHQYRNRAGKLITSEQLNRMDQGALKDWIMEAPATEPKTNDQGVINFLAGWARELVAA